MSYTVNLYNNSSDIHRMHKNITSRASVDCEFKAPIDVENPTIYINASADYDDVNYVYIPEFSRYYFAKCTGGTSNTLTFECTSDPLMSFKNGILSSPAVVSRNPWHYDKYLHDNRLPVEQRTYRQTIAFPYKDKFDGTNNCYILITLGTGE